MRVFKVWIDKVGDIVWNPSIEEDEILRWTDFLDVDWGDEDSYWLILE